VYCCHLQCLFKIISTCAIFPQGFIHTVQCCCYCNISVEHVEYLLFLWFGFDNVISLFGNLNLEWNLRSSSLLQYIGMKDHLKPKQKKKYYGVESCVEHGCAELLHEVFLKEMFACFLFNYHIWPQHLILEKSIVNNTDVSHFIITSFRPVREVRFCEPYVYIKLWGLGGGFKYCTSWRADNIRSILM
jgi:hypothetical protein